MKIKFLLLENFGNIENNYIILEKVSLSSFMERPNSTTLSSKKTFVNIVKRGQ